MNDKDKVSLFILLFLGVAFATGLFLYSNDIAVLSPKGLIATKERRLILTATLLMLIVVVPVYFFTFFIAWRYRAGNQKAKYTPDWDHHRGLEILWWAIPGLIILVLGVVAWKSSNELEPFKPLGSNTKTVTIQVVALQWKWLFIYPEQGVASVNFVQFPQATPINFVITSDAPMNSFWIPQLGGQIYAMSGMSTHLHLSADAVGNFNGSSANISGRGFSGMKFIARSSTQAEFESWLAFARRSTKTLNLAEYNKLATPSENNPALYYGSTQKDLFASVVTKYTHPSRISAAQVPTLGRQ